MSLCVLFGIGWSLAGSAGAQSAPASTVLRLQLTGVVDPFVADYLGRGIADATSAGDAAVLIEIDTPGGLDSSMRKITQAILNANIPVICYVAPQGARAASAGAFVLMSCPIAAMAPGTNVGAATPVGVNGATESSKAVNDAAATMLSLAEARGRNKGVAVSFVTDAVSISAEQALSDSVIDLISPTEGQLLTALDGRQVTLANGSTVTLSTAGADVVDRGMGGFIGFLHGLLDPDLAFIFFWLGLGLIVLEILLPGHILSGTLGTILLILAIVSFGLLPVRLIGIGLLVASAVAFAIEAAHPGLGIWGIIGVVALVLGGWFLYDRAGGGGVSPWVIVPGGGLRGAVLRIRRDEGAGAPQHAAAPGSGGHPGPRRRGPGVGPGSWRRRPRGCGRMESGVGRRRDRGRHPGACHGDRRARAHRRAGRSTAGARGGGRHPAGSAGPRRRRNHLDGTVADRHRGHRDPVGELCSSARSRSSASINGWWSSGSDA